MKPEPFFAGWKTPLERAEASLEPGTKIKLQTIIALILIDFSGSWQGLDSWGIDWRWRP